MASAVDPPRSNQPLAPAAALHTKSGRLAPSASPSTTPKTTPRGALKARQGKSSGELQAAASSGTLGSLSPPVSNRNSRPPVMGDSRQSGVQRPSSRPSLRANAASSSNMVSAPAADATPLHSPVPSARLNSSAQAQVAKQQWERAEKEEARLAELKQQQPLVVRLGLLLARQELRAIDLMRQWDINGDGAVSRDEFASSVRSLGLEATAAEIDEVFRLLDDDGSGSLELTELKAHLRGLMDSAQAAMARTAKVEENVEVMRRRARQAQQVLDAIEQAEKKEAQLNELRAQQPLVVRLGGVFKSITNPALMMKSWDTNGDGVLSKIEFRQQARHACGERCGVRGARGEACAGEE